MRDLRVLSAKGHPETLKRDEKNKKTKHTILTYTNPTQMASRVCEHLVNLPETGGWEKK